MIRNFFKTGLRNIFKNKVYGLINLVGLTCGISLALLILTYVRSEVTYDNFHPKGDRLYRIQYRVPNGLQLAVTPPPIAPVMRDFFPEVEDACRLYPRNVTISKPGGDGVFEETNVYFADSSFTKLFKLDFVKGSPKRPLYEKFTVVINEEMAVKYFGDHNPIGETLLFGGKHSFKVIGVVKDFPENSHLRFNMLVPFDNMFDMESDAAAQVLRNNLAQNFIISHSFTYVLLHPGADPTNVDRQMGAFLEKYARPDRRIGQVFTLMKVADIHMKSTSLGEPSATNTYSNLYLFIGVGILTLLIACINYINLTTAQSLTRLKEIGVRKILGSERHQLIIQFLSESFLFCAVALIISFGIFYLALPFLNLLTGKTLQFNVVTDTTLFTVCGFLLIGLTVLAGGYPSYFISQFNSVSSIKGSPVNHPASQWLRRSLVVFQLAIACALLSGSLVILNQLDYTQNRPLGFQKEHIVNIPLFSQNLNGVFRQNDSTFWSKLQAYRDVVETQNGIRQTAVSSGTPGLGIVFRGIIPEGFTQNDNLFAANLAVDYDFISTYEMQLAAGRSFSRESGNDATEGYIVNETAVREYKWQTPEQAIGKTINKEGKKGKVIGVVKDFNFSSLTTPISALIMDINPNQYNTLTIRFDNENILQTISSLEKKWNELFPEKGFQFTFLQEQLNQQYRNFQNFGTIIQTFTGIAVLIACLGVYGLILFVVQRKVKEIGVRKVLGATVPGILKLIYSDFIWLILIGFVIAVPVSYYLLNQWLTNFIYHISIGYFTYAISLGLVLLITTLTIGYHAFKASIANPVKSLRTE
ncbi:ABC transporter permease [Cytophagales bacterium WSM2-2]|nr:ABC transporter permease [Cytophagales bacterium WSM2-2]